VRIFVSGASRTVVSMASGDPELSQHLGHLITPQNGNDLRSLLRSGLPWGLDNSAYSKPDDIKFWNLGIKAWDWMAMHPPEWVAVPDVVGDHTATLQKFFDWTEYWQYEMDTIPWKLAFVLQNGATIKTIPWDCIDAVFVGGTDGFKLHGCHDLIAEAQRLGLWVHVGRVNSFKRAKWFYDLGVDSIDGSGFSMFPDKKIPRALRHLKLLRKTQLLF
jgi:hypothetical protein